MGSAGGHQGKCGPRLGLQGLLCPHVGHHVLAPGLPPPRAQGPVLTRGQGSQTRSWLRNAPPWLCTLAQAWRLAPGTCTWGGCFVGDWLFPGPAVGGAWPQRLHL